MAYDGAVPKHFPSKSCSGLAKFCSDLRETLSFFQKDFDTDPFRDMPPIFAGLTAIANAIEGILVIKNLHLLFHSTVKKFKKISTRLLTVLTTSVIVCIEQRKRVPEFRK